MQHKEEEGKAQQHYIHWRTKSLINLKDMLRRFRSVDGTDSSLTIQAEILQDYVEAQGPDMFHIFMTAVEEENPEIKEHGEENA